MIRDATDEMAELFTTCGGQVWRAVLAASAGRRDIADDVTAEAFSQYLQHREEVRDPLAYLFRIAYRLLAKERAREKHHVELLDRNEAAASQSVLSPALTEALLGVSIEQRFAVVLHYFCDYPVAERARAIVRADPNRSWPGPAATLAVRAVQETAANAAAGLRLGRRTGSRRVGGHDGDCRPFAA